MYISTREMVISIICNACGVLGLILWVIEAHKSNADQHIQSVESVEADTPQTDCDKCIWNVCNYNKVDWDADTPQTDVYDYKGNGKWERNE